MPSVWPASGVAMRRVHLLCFWSSTMAAYGLVRWNSAPMMFSAIDSRWVPRAQVSVSAAGRSGSASQPSTPAVSACAQRSFGICGSRPGGAPQASIASVSARCA